MRRRLGLGGHVRCAGLWGSSAALVGSGLAEGEGAVSLFITPSAEVSDFLASDLRLFSARDTKEYPAYEILPSEADSPELEVASARMEVLDAVEAGGRLNVAAPVEALGQAVERLSEGEQIDLRAGEEIDIGRVLAWLTDRGYERVWAVEGRGQYALRGGIMDVFPVVSRAGGSPYRVELVGDEVESIRAFDPVTQRSEEPVNSCVLTSLPRKSGRASLVEVLPASAPVFVLEPEQVQKRAGLFGSPIGWERIWRAVSERRLVELRSIGTGALDEVVFDVAGLGRFDASFEKAAAELGELARRLKETVLFCSSPRGEARLRQMLEGVGAVRFERGRLREGFEFREISTAFCADHEVFHRSPERRRARRKGLPVASYMELEPGDYVVHARHGIARFLGLQTLEREGKKEEFLLLLFDAGSKLYVPVTQVALVQKYIGGDAHPRLDRVGGKSWEKRRARVAAATRDIAAELLAIQAARRQNPGIVYPPDGEWQEAFEAAFPYEETLDQLRACAEVKRDMERPVPMDKLLCGDVGFGKTEVALRAAFKAVCSGRQVAVLVPTTLLAEQHGRTLRERLKPYPLRVGVLSRLRSPAEQRAILKGLEDGKVDAVIGTHRLLSRDVRFRDLGLLVVDEEQRFGVAHKERLKKLRTTVDVLTMTATPIPRTLHMALAGLRDIATLAMPPADRLSVRTTICRFNDGLIRRAVLREIERGGQVYFIHNRVESIAGVAGKLREILPGVSFVVCHGQMENELLEERMAMFIEGEANVLVSTAIVENGLDIPNANTIFIDKADLFGLADLHQLRGRVGRYKHRAYAYFLASDFVTPEARRRLRAIQELDELGAGFKIAMRDLEIRGAGNILGAEQSGHIAEVGYDLYVRLLERAVKELQGAPAAGEDVVVTSNLKSGAFIPLDYIADERTRLEIYRRALGEDPEGLGGELADRFGPPPEEVRRLLRESAVRRRCRALRLPYVGLEGKWLVFKLMKTDFARMEKRLRPLGDVVRAVDAETFQVWVGSEEFERVSDAAERVLNLLGG